MRIALGLLTAALLILGAHTLAQGDDAAGADDMQSLKARVEALEYETEYLRAREAALTAYILENQQRAQMFAATGAKAREEGFEHRKTPTPSRITLLRGLEAVWASVGSELPEVTKEQTTLLKRAQAMRKLKGLGK